MPIAPQDRLLSNKKLFYKLLTLSKGNYLLFFCSTCTEGGHWQCDVDDDCVGRCHITGDPYYKTFDSRQFSFEGHCEYVLTQPGIGAKVGVNSELDVLHMQLILGFKCYFHQHYLCFS